MNIHKSLKVLGLTPDASFQEARKAYKKLVKRWHPDRFFDDASQMNNAEEALKRINQAYTDIEAWFKSRPTGPFPTKPPSPSPHKKATTGFENLHHGKDKIRDRHSWMDNLMNRFNTFAKHRTGAGKHPSEKDQNHGSPARKAKTFDQVLNEISRGNTINFANNSENRRKYPGRTNAYRFRRTRRSGSSVGSVAGVERISRIRPVQRIGRIGKK